MIVTTRDLLSDANGNEIIENSAPENYKDIGYDLRIKNIILVSEDGKEHEELDKYDLPAGNTVFVSTIENIKMPLDLIGIVTQRNSIIRRGLKVDAPIYLPGHHTKLFLRVTNISKNEISLFKEAGIASIMFEKLSSDAPEYKGEFVDEFNYTGVGNFKNDIPKVTKIDKKMESLENIEKTLYEKVIVLLTIFIGIFSLINLNVQFLSEAMSIDKMFVFNLFSIGSLGMLVSFIGFILHDKLNRASIILTISVILIIAALLIAL